VLSIWKPNVDFDFVNGSVMPNNPYLLCKYNFHINDEVCALILAVIYTCK
jgi:hypothetical protein